MKFVGLGLGEMIEIIVSGQNWGLAFEPDFASKVEVEWRIKQVKRLRDAFAHGRHPDTHALLDGLSGLHWLSGCLAAPELDPSLIFASAKSV